MDCTGSTGFDFRCYAFQPKWANTKNGEVAVDGRPRFGRTEGPVTFYWITGTDTDPDGAAGIAGNGEVATSVDTLADVTLLGSIVS